MAQEQLKTVSGSGTQSATQTPQAAGTSAGQTAAAAGVQPGTATGLLNSSNAGIALKNTPLSVVGLGQRTGTASVQAQPLAKHHTSPVLFGFSIILFVLAISMFAMTARSSKNTTE